MESNRQKNYCTFGRSKTATPYVFTTYTLVCFDIFSILPGAPCFFPLMVIFAISERVLWMSMINSFHSPELSSCHRVQAASDWPHHTTMVSTETIPFGPAFQRGSHIIRVEAMYVERGISCSDLWKSGCIICHHFMRAIPNSAESKMVGAASYFRQPFHDLFSHLFHSSGWRSTVGRAFCIRLLGQWLRRNGFDIPLFLSWFHTQVEPQAPTTSLRIPATQNQGRRWVSAL